jgi:predicted O-methyltransferase YrrM
MGILVADAVEQYVASLNRAADPLLLELAEEGRRRNLPLAFAEAGALLRVQALAVGARRILEIGTAIGYSGLWLAAALPPDGMLITIERDPERAEEARRNFERAGFSSRVSVIIGDASRMLHKLAGPFDLIFQDGPKTAYVPMLDPLVALLRTGGLLITDNVLWHGEVVPGLLSAPVRGPVETAAIAEYNERLASDPRLLTTWLPVHDGVSISVKR